MHPKLGNERMSLDGSVREGNPVLETRHLEDVCTEYNEGFLFLSKVHVASLRICIRTVMLSAYRSVSLNTTSYSDVQ